VGMKELGFDELDKAVNSLMGDVPQTDEPLKDTPSSIETAEDSISPSSEGSTSPTLTPNAPARETVSPALPSPASRRGGRFMDVVHPSSDMKTTRMGASSREGVSITPPASTVIPEQTTPSSEEAAPAVEATAETPATSEWPDPIALHEEKQTDQSGGVSNSEETSTADTPFDTPPAPLTSPFLTDAKVEKRPLGGSQALDQAMATELGKVDTTEPTDTTPEFVSPAPEETQAESAPEASAPSLLSIPEEKAPLPAELDSDLVAIEAGGATTTEKQSSPAAPAPIETTPTPAIGAGSIQQQYTEQPSTGDESHAAIYDTDAAQQPLLHPPKKKTGWLVTIWIVLIIILGIGVGATIWYFGLI